MQMLMYPLSLPLSDEDRIELETQSDVLKKLRRCLIEDIYKQNSVNYERLAKLFNNKSVIDEINEEKETTEILLDRTKSIRLKIVQKAKQDIEAQRKYFEIKKDLYECISPKKVVEKETALIKHIDRLKIANEEAHIYISEWLRPPLVTMEKLISFLEKCDKENSKELSDFLESTIRNADNAFIWKTFLNSKLTLKTLINFGYEQ